MEARIETDRAGFITWAENTERLLNLSQRAAIGRDLLLFFPADRRVLLGELSRAVDGMVVQPVLVTLRPRDRRPIAVRVVMVALDTTPRTIRWEIRSVTQSDDADDD